MSQTALTLFPSGAGPSGHWAGDSGGVGADAGVGEIAVADVAAESGFGDAPTAVGAGNATGGGWWGLGGGKCENPLLATAITSGVFITSHNPSHASRTYSSALCMRRSTVTSGIGITFWHIAGKSDRILYSKSPKAFRM